VKYSKETSTAVAGLVLCAVVACAACSSSHPSASRGASSSTAAAPAKPAPTTVANLPVVTCPTTTLGTQPRPPRHPDHETVTLPTPDVKRVWFYSNDRITVLGPRHWLCSATVGADGSVSMFVVPPGSVSSTNPDIDYAGVFVNTDNTGRGFGQALVCGYFPNSAAARVGLLCDHPPKGTKTKALSTDVVSFTHGPTSGLAIYPKSGEASASVDVARIACDAGTVCTSILRDALTRFQPK
jgi:hypothetical protein